MLDNLIYQTMIIKMQEKYLILNQKLYVKLKLRKKCLKQ